MVPALELKSYDLIHDVMIFAPEKHVLKRNGPWGLSRKRRRDVVFEALISIEDDSPPRFPMLIFYTPPQIEWLIRNKRRKHDAFTLATHQMWAFAEVLPLALVDGDHAIKHRVFGFLC